jgi:RNA polymerase sigma factor for flagellar operon FliA
VLDPRMVPLVEQYRPLAQTLAQKVWRTAPHALELDELRAIAQLGLVDAADRWYPYCADRGYSPEAVQFFRPFVIRRVHGALIDAMRASDWATRSLRSRARQLADAGAERGLTDHELARRTGLSVAEVRNTIRGMAARPVSLETEEIDPRSGQNVESTVAAQTILGHLVSAIRALSVDQQAVIALHYHRGLQLQQVASVMGITESRASQLHAKAVLTVHTAMRAAA